ncbi:MAG: tRNA (N(6)-L-threonylcarbamoyladenosine(37)-C(2))-methylthiotransferase MtaB [Eubacteriales bacterium]|nr:tRNA (N(6)-L-threonylcarbamoyladenosine(37)-C(2))-methylthiotransferase MtaB [Eubacteriales bacterium]
MNNNNNSNNNNECNIKLTAALYTLGCKVNQYESRAMAERLKRMGVSVRNGGVCDIYIINSCAVTAESERKTRQLIRRCAALSKDAVVAVCGCSSQLHRERIAAVAGVDIVCGSADKHAAADKALELALLRKQNRQGVVSVDRTFDIGNEYDRSMAISGFDRVRAYVKIEDGCNARCAYCIIPRVRGPVRSRPPSDITGEIERLAASGCREIVLTGIETSAYSYGSTGLIGLLEAVDKIKGIERIRLGSMDPAFLTAAFAKGIAGLEHFMPHLHVSLQSGSNRILRAMRRKYNAETALRNLENIRALIPGMQFSADIIVGFPGETEEDFSETLRFAQRTGFLHIHIFTYSRRPGTEAAEMPDQTDEALKNERAAVLAALQADIKSAILDSTVKAGKPARVLFESYKDKSAFGHAEDFTEYAVAGEGNLQGDIRTVMPLSRDGGRITCRISI